MSGGFPNRERDPNVPDHPFSASKPYVACNVWFVCGLDPVQLGAGREMGVGLNLGFPLQEMSSQTAMDPENLENLPQPEVPLYSIPSIALASFLGGPLAAGWLVSVNFRRLNDPKAARTAVFNGILATVALIGVMMALPPDWTSRVPGVTIPAIYTAAIWVLAERFQGRPLAAHFARGGRRHSPWRAVGVSLIAALPMGLVLVGMVLIVPMSPPFGFTGEPTPYGDEGDVVFHTGEVPESLIEEVGTVLIEEGMLVNGQRDSVELRLDGDGYVLTVPVVLSSWSDRGLMKQLARIEEKLAESDPSRSVRIEIVHQGVSGIQRRSPEMEPPGEPGP